MSRDTRASFMTDAGLDDTPLTWGKYSGRTPRSVAKADPSYVVWMHANVLDKPTCTRELALECEENCDEPDENDEEERWARSERGYGKW